MHLRPSQLEELYTTCESVGLSRDALEIQKGNNFLPQAWQNRPQWSQKFCLVEKTTGSFFLIGMPWSCFCSPGIETKLSEPVDLNREDWSVLVRHFRDWSARVTEERECSWVWQQMPLREGPLQFLRATQLQQVHRLLQDCGFPDSIWEWRACSSHHAMLHVKLDPFSFTFSRNSQEPVRGPVSVRYSPGAHEKWGSAGNLSWAKVIEQFNIWLNSLKADLPAAERLRSYKSHTPKPAVAYLTSIELENIRMFEHCRIEFEGRPGEQRLFLGTNGSGKSTLLRCLAIATAAKAVAQELLNKPSARLVTPGQVASLKVTWKIESESHEGAEANPTGSRMLRIELDDQNHQVIVDEQGEDFLPGLVVGYGSGRGAQGASERPSSSAASLFDYSVRSVSPELAIRRLYDHYKEEGFAEKFAAFKRLLDLDGSVTLPPPNGGRVEVRLKASEGPGVLLDSWADGYRLTLAWFLDVFDWALDQDRLGSDGPQGVLLLDEVEQHLHPKLQSHFLEKLGQALPQMQVIATTHSPLVTLGCPPELVRRLNKDKNGQVVVRPVPDFRNDSVEDIIASGDIFDTDPLNPWLRRLLLEQKKLREQPIRTEAEEERLRELNKKLWDLVEVSESH